MGVYLTADIHSKAGERFSFGIFPHGRELTEEDYIIILGDFGLIWDCKGESKNEKYWLDWLNDKPWTTLFIDGNHENYDRLNNYETYPVKEWHGGKVQFIRDKVIHLMRGEIFEICGKTFLAMGGAESHDISGGILEPDDPNFKEKYKKCIADPFCLFRVNHVSWWAEEVPSAQERINALNNLEKYNRKVDFVLSHEAPASDVAFLGGGWYKPTEYSQFLEELRACIDYGYWGFGHYHVDRAVNRNEWCHYSNITQVV